MEEKSQDKKISKENLEIDTKTSLDRLDSQKTNFGDIFGEKIKNLISGSENIGEESKVEYEEKIEINKERKEVVSLLKSFFYVIGIGNNISKTIEEKNPGIFEKKKKIVEPQERVKEKILEPKKKGFFEQKIRRIGEKIEKEENIEKKDEFFSQEKNLGDTNQNQNIFGGFDQKNFGKQIKKEKNIFSIFFGRKKKLIWFFLFLFFAILIYFLFKT